MAWQGKPNRGVMSGFAVKSDGEKHREAADWFVLCRSMPTSHKCQFRSRYTKSDLIFD
jgi:hypothetical protein